MAESKAKQLSQMRIKTYLSPALTCLLLAGTLALMGPEHSPVEPTSASITQGQVNPKWIPRNAFRKPYHFSLVTITKDEKFRVATDFSATSRRVSMSWKHLASGETALQYIPTEFTPTAVCYGHREGLDEIYVAGKTRIGATIIQRWKVDPPQEVLDAGSGAVGDIILRSLEAINTVYSAAQPGMDVVAAMCLVLDSDTELLVKFADSNSVYVMDVYARPATTQLVASGQAFSAALLKDDSLNTWHSGIQQIRVNDGTPDGQARYYFSNAKQNGPGTMLVSDQGGANFIEIIPIVGVDDWITHGFPDEEDRLPTWQ